jgi:pyruvate/2-oxoglutarate dehydrogenase complex dihydrolipoamide dehydrogenase (E3) component
MGNVKQPVQVDLLVIGFGKGGKTLAATMGRTGKRVIMVEESDQMYGGTCINVGCVPTKALVHRADTRRPDDGAEAWYQQAVGAVSDLTTLLRGKNFQMLDEIDTVTVVTGKAAFVDPKTVEVTAGDDRLTIRADNIVINTGAQPVIPEIPGLRDSRHTATSAEMLRTTTLPGRLAVLGGGYLGLEFAAMYRQFGSEVTVLESRTAFMDREDEDVAEAALHILREQGITLLPGSLVTEIRDGAGSATIHYVRDGRDQTLEVDTILVAAGRVPATAALRLDRAEVRTTDRGAVEVDEYLRTSQPHIYAIGDVNGGPQFTYISLDDNRVVADQLLGAGTRSTADRRAVPHTMFMTPPFSTVGLTETQAREQGHRVKIASKPVAQIAAMPRSRIMEDTRGLMKFIIDADTDLVLGAALLSIDSQELINLVALAMRHQVSASELRDTIYNHPSSSEALNEVLANAR